MTREWLPVFAGPIAWFTAHVASWMLVPGAHEAGSLAGLWVIDLAALAVAIVAAVASGVRLRRLLHVAPADRAVQRARFVAGSALALSIFSAALVIALVLPLLLLVPGAEP